MNFYRWLQRGLPVSVTMQNDETTYYVNRGRFNELLSTGGATSAEAASLFYYLNRTGYNGLCRFNASGLFNVPFGRFTRIEYRRNFDEYVTAFATYEFTCADFDRLPLRGDDFVYPDPPYDVEFTQYSSGGFDWNAQVRAAEWLARHRGPVVLSNQATDRIVTLYEELGYRITMLSAPRRISCTGDRTPAAEVLATRNL